MRKSTLLAASLALTVLGTLPASAQTASPVAVRAAAHEDFDRIVFDWPRDVKFQFSREGDRASISFDAAATMKFGKDIQSYLSRARGFATHTDEQGNVTVSFTVNTKATVKTFTSNHSVVIDVSGKAAEAKDAVAAPAPSPAVPAAPAAPAPVAETKVEAKAEAKAEAVAQPVAPAAETPAAATGKPQALVPAAAVAAKPAAPVAPKPATAVAEKTMPPVATPVPAPVAAPIPPPPEKATVTEPAPTGFPKTTVAPTVASTPVAVPSSPLSSVARIQQKNSEQSLALSTTPMLVATLDPRIPVRAAIYQRAETGYVIFDHKLTLSPAALENGIPALIDLQAFDMPKSSGYRFPVPPNSSIQATMDGTVWKIFLSKKQSVIAVSTALVAQPDFALGARYLLPLPDAPDPIKFTDPVVGDDLILVPLAQSEAFNTERQTSDFTVLPAAQGMVIKPLNEKVIVRPVSDGIEITAEGGLLMSPSADTGAQRQSSTKTKAVATGKSIFDFTTWKGKPGETFTKSRQRLQQTIVDVPEAERNRARLELARFYFAHGQGEEAVSLLNMLVKQVPDLKAHADFSALLGAAQIMAYRGEEGVRNLSIPALADQPEVGLWMAVAAAQARDWQTAEEKFSTRETVLAGYPEPFFSRFFVLAIESAMAMNKDHEAADWLDYVDKVPHSEAIEPALDYLRGVMHAKAGRAAAAEKSWKEAQRSKDRLYKIRAELALIDLGVSTASLTPAQAADRLEALRFGWRGDDLEVDILHRLGQFYVQAKNVKAGLNAMSQAITLYPASPLTPAIRSEMASTFHDVFLGGMTKKFSPLDGLTLYQQYHDLMPSGKEGDEVMKNLSERLVAVDLLDQASAILEDLVKNRLQGEEKTRAALRLSAIRLLNHKPTESMAALDAMGNETLSPALQNERVLLRARALSELHRDDDATALLKDNSSPGAKMLRADIAMHAQKWGEAAKVLMDMVGSPPASGTQLTADQARWLINAAIAYALDNDQTGLDRLAIDYSAAMTGQPQKDTFMMLTRQEKTGQLRDLAAAQSQISQVDMFQGFLNSYRKDMNADAPLAKKP